MTDLHTHILPGIDDGAASVEEAVQLIESLYQQNIIKAACTPHFDPTKISLQDFIDKRNIALDLLKGSKITLIPASETRMSEYLFHYPDLSALCIGNTKYILLELPFDKKWNDKYLDILDKIINYYNVIPIIAHIERYKSLNIRVTKKLRDLGCIIQMNTSSILDNKSNKKCIHLLKSGLIDVLGSDCHNMKDRMPIFMEALSFIAKNFGENTCYMLDYNSECIINNIEIKKRVNYIIDK